MKRTPLISLLAAMVFIACQEVTDAPVSDFKAPDEIVNPNGDSELSLVMRNLHYEADLVGRSLEKNGEADLSKLKRLAARISTAQPTDSSDLKGAYYSFADNLQNKVDHLDSDDAVIQYNEMIKTCVACHKTTCPGPISKIRKLKIKS